MTPADGYWLAGLIDGEGSFNILANHSGPRPTFHISLRADDEATIREVRRILGFGRIYYEKKMPRPGRNNQAAVRLVVANIADCPRLVETLRAYPLRSKKARDFEVWATAVAATTRRLHGSRWGKAPGKIKRDLLLFDLKRRLETLRRVA